MEVKTKTAVAETGNGKIAGYASTWTREPDAYGDIVAKGAFAESIAAIEAEGKVIPLLWNHNSGDLKAYIGTVTKLAEDEHGLYFKAGFDATEEAQRARELSADGRICKVSFAYDVLDEAEVELEDGRKANELRKLNIHEVSLVMYPANRDTSVVEVKSDTVTCSIDPAANVTVQAVIDQSAIKAGRRNSAKDAEELERIGDLAASIQSIVNGLLAERADEPQPDTESEKAKGEEPDTANSEEPVTADVEELLKVAGQLLEKGDA